MINPKTSRLVPGKIYKVFPSWKGSNVVRLFKVEDRNLGPLVDEDCVVMLVKLDVDALGITNGGAIVLYENSLYWMHVNHLGWQITP